MASCLPWKYKNVTPAVFRSLQTLGKQKGITIPSTPSGTFTVKVAGMQVSFQYAWDGKTGQLMLKCVSKPPLLGCSTIKGFADKIVAESGGKSE
ncbi:MULTISPECIES: hypothetical protein [Paenibacillus]|jgi:hypothetical protein|uniref:Uncharacterized protein n=1 Tax=Paenibacillus oceani TaxID=2772510 RepID=A0A927H0B8_9BACL|nr:hypothetical protein [Paenibacillus oceani]MBD2862982.1 hypothetical protein [Paenibacillus oceani]MDF2663475.1 hypothetical protein [Paenibacillus sp.]